MPRHTLTVLFRQDPKGRVGPDHAASTRRTCKGAKGPERNEDKVANADGESETERGRTPEIGEEAMDGACEHSWMLTTSF